jgi:hypothetical protein
MAVFPPAQARPPPPPRAEPAAPPPNPFVDPFLFRFTPEPSGAEQDFMFDY